jgi:hypothetical protein
MGAQHLPRPTARLPLVIVGFDDRPQLQAWIDRRQARREAAQLVAMIQMRREGVGISWRDDQPVDPVGERPLEQRDIALAEPWIRSELDLDRRRELSRGFTNALAERLSEQRHPIGQMHGNPPLLARPQVAGGKIRRIAERRGGGEDALSRDGIDARLAMERAIHRPG